MIGTSATNRREEEGGRKRRAHGERSLLRPFGVGVNGGGGDRLGQDQSLRPHFGIGVREGKMRRPLRSHLWLKIGTLLSGEASPPLSLLFSLHAMCLSHVDFFPLHPPPPSAHMEFHSHKTPRHRSFLRPSIAARKHVSRTEIVSLSLSVLSVPFSCPAIVCRTYQPRRH